MYLETLQNFVGKLERLIVLDEKQRNLLPLLDLGRLSEGGLVKQTDKATDSNALPGHSAGTGEKTP